MSSSSESKVINHIPDNIQLIKNREGIPTYYQVPGYPRHRITIPKEKMPRNPEDDEKFERYRIKRLLGKWPGKTGSKDEVAIGLRERTSAGITRNDMMINAKGKVVLKSRYNRALQVTSAN